MMWNVPEALRGLTGSGIEEVLRFAYVASGLVPAGLVVGVASVLAGLLGAAALRKTRGARPGVPSRARVPWVLGAAVLASAVVPAPSDAAVLCRKGASSRLVMRAEACRGRERAVDPRDLDLAGVASCVQDIASAWDDLAAVRRQLEDARDLATVIAAHPWDGATTWLLLEAAQIVQTLARLDASAKALGIPAARGPIGRMRSAVTEHWSRPADACNEALLVVPELESLLPVPAAD